MSTPRIALITSSLPERHDFRAEALRSVEAQTLKPIIHLVGVDYQRLGPAPIQNYLLAAAVAAGAEWIALLADDDLLYPNHLEKLYSGAAEADIVWTWCDVQGRNWNPNSHWDPQRLRSENFIPATAMIRTEWCERLGWEPAFGKRCEDWLFWRKAHEAGARFVCVPEKTWLYRFHGSNQSTSGG